MAHVLDFVNNQAPDELKLALERSVNPVSFTDGSAVPGNATANSSSGRHAIDAVATACVVTCNQCAANSVVIVTLETLDATAITPVVVPAAGSFTVTVPESTNITKFRWFIAGQGR